MIRFILIFLFPAFVFSQAVNLSTYGAVGNGITDDTAALQAAFDSGNNLFATEGSTFLISANIWFDVAGDQNIDWNNSTVIASDPGQRMFSVQKSSGILSMQDLFADGDDLSDEAFWIRSPVNFNNVDVGNLYMAGSAQNVLGFFLLIYDSTAYDDFLFDGCDCDGINDKDDLMDNNLIGDAAGSGRCFQLTWYEAPSPAVTITVQNGIFTNVLCEDGDVLQTLDVASNVTEVGLTENVLVFRNMEISNWGRRGLKGLGGAVHFINCTITSPPSSLPGLPTSPALGPAGMLAIASQVESQKSTNVLIEGCTFIGSNRETGVIIGTSEGTEINNSVFSGGADLRFYRLAGNSFVCSNEFQSGSFIEDYGEVSNDGIKYIGNNNTYIEGSPINLDYFTWQYADLTCDPVSDPNQGGGGGGGASPPDEKINGTSAMLISH